MEIDLLDPYELYTLFKLKVYIMVNCTNSANSQLSRGQLYKIRERLTTEPYRTGNGSKLTCDEEFWDLWSWFPDLWLSLPLNKSSTWLTLCVCEYPCVLKLTDNQVVTFDKAHNFKRRTLPQGVLFLFHFWGRSVLLEPGKSSEYLPTLLLGNSKRSPLDPLWL